MTRRALGAAIVVALLLSGSSCRHAQAAASVLDGSPRVPDVEGVATSVTRQRVVIAGRGFAVSDRLECFSPYDGKPVPLLDQQGRYVQAGVRSGKLVWISGFGAPVGARPVVTYTGRFDRMVKGRMVFAGGVTFAVTPGLAPPPSGPIDVVVLADRRQVVGYTPLSGARAG